MGQQFIIRLPDNAPEHEWMRARLIAKAIHDGKPVVVEEGLRIEWLAEPQAADEPVEAPAHVHGPISQTIAAICAAFGAGAAILGGVGYARTGMLEAALLGLWGALVLLLLLFAWVTQDHFHTGA